MYRRNTFVFNGLTLLNDLVEDLDRVGRQGFVFLTLLSIMCVSVFAQPDTLWTRSFGGYHNLWGTGIQESSDGGFIAAGNINIPAGSNDSLVWVIKMSASGDSLWSRPYAFPSSVMCAGLCTASDGGYMVAGSAADSIWGTAKGFLLKISDAGDSLWSRRFPGRSAFFVASILATSDGGYVLAGTNISGDSGQRACAIKTNANGDSVWSLSYGDATCRLHGACQAPGGRFLLSGEILSLDVGNMNFLLLSVDTLGHLEWARTYVPPPSYDAGPAHVAVCPDGSCYLVGEATRIDSFGTNTVLAKIGVQGDSIWKKIFDGDDWIACHSASVLPDGGCVLGGSIEVHYPAEELDYWLARVNVNGDTLWTARYPHPNPDYCNDVHVTADDGYIMFGGSTGGVGLSSFYAVRTAPDPLLSAHPYAVPYPSSFSLSNYPNPFNPSTWISFNLPREGNVSLKIFDMLGREVATVADGRMSAGSHQLLYDGKSFASGTYLVRLEAEGRAQSSKIMLLK